MACLQADEKEISLEQSKTLFVAVHLLKRLVEINVEIIPWLVTTLV